MPRGLLRSSLMRWSVAVSLLCATCGDEASVVMASSTGYDSSSTGAPQTPSPAECPTPIHVGPEPLPDAVLGETYEVNILEFIHGTGGVVYTTGEVSDGLSLIGHTLLTGTPEETGEFEFVVEIGDHAARPPCSGLLQTNTLTLSVVETAAETSASSGTGSTTSDETDGSAGNSETGASTR
jgi:hypothetical protein